VRVRALGTNVSARLSNAIAAADAGGMPAASASTALERVADVPVYGSDPIVRRAPSLQLTRDAAPPRARMNAATLTRLALAAGDTVRVRQSLGDAGQGEALLEAAFDAGVADGVVRIAAAHAGTSRLGSMFGEIVVERA
jgi:NADH-quinone oxidoreductase subunit G